MLACSTAVLRSSNPPRVSEVSLYLYVWYRTAPHTRSVLASGLKGILSECVVIRTHIYRLYMSTTTQSQQLPGLAHPTTYQVVAEEPILPPLKSIVISQHPRSSHIGSYILRSGPERSGGGSQPPGRFPSFVRTRNLH